jgi:hypothetical protein
MFTCLYIPSFLAILLLKYSEFFVVNQSFLDAPLTICLATVKGQWTVHSLNLIQELFGLHFVHYADCIIIDQTDKAENIITGIHNSNWKNQLVTPSFFMPIAEKWHCIWGISCTS